MKNNGKFFDSRDGNHVKGFVEGWHMGRAGSGKMYMAISMKQDFQQLQTFVIWLQFSEETSIMLFL